MVILSSVKRFGRVFFKCLLHGVHVYLTPSQILERWHRTSF